MTYTSRTQSSAFGHTIQDRYGLRIAARLQAGTEDLPHDISERLRAAREQALAKRKMPLRATQAARAGAALATGGGTLSMGGGDNLGFWGRMAAGTALVLLVVGMVTIDVVKDDERVDEIAAVDAALLSDDVPPSAHADPGFVQFLKYGLPDR
jgi:Protein of unknown function (DUF3619)